MRVWRLASGEHSRLDGEGAWLFGGRWNSPGVPVVYTATHLALVLLEQLVHLNPEQLPDRFRAFAIDLPDEATVERAPPSIAIDDVLHSRRLGDAWARSVRSAALLVPSVIVSAVLAPGDLATEERNVVLNPRHSSAPAWQVRETSFRLDPRLRRAPPG